MELCDRCAHARLACCFASCGPTMRSQTIRENSHGHPQHAILNSCWVFVIFATRMHVLICWVNKNSLYCNRCLGSWVFHWNKTWPTKFHICFLLSVFIVSRFDCISYWYLRQIVDSYVMCHNGYPCEKSWVNFLWCSYMFLYLVLHTSRWQHTITVICLSRYLFPQRCNTLFVIVRLSFTMWMCFSCSFCSKIKLPLYGAYYIKKMKKKN